MLYGLISFGEQHMTKNLNHCCADLFLYEFDVSFCFNLRTADLILELQLPNYTA